MHPFLGFLCSALSLSVLLGLAPARAQPTGVPSLSPPLGGAAKAAAPSSAKRPAFREIKWEDLMPPNWDPMKEIKAMNIDALQDGDPRATALLKRLRESWDNAPINPAIDGAAVRVPGYVVPLEETPAGLKEFLLVPYFGACVHTPPPPSNQIIHVLPKSAAKGFRSMDTVWISGTIKTLHSDTFMGASSYRLSADLVEPYAEKGR